MFDKIIKVAQTCLLALLLGVVGWFCWARRDVGRFTFHENGDTATVFDGKTGLVYILLPGKADGTGKPAWVATQPQTGLVISRQLVLPVATASTGQPPQTQDPMDRAFGVTRQPPSQDPIGDAMDRIHGVKRSTAPESPIKAAPRVK
jgi:hypothetical protein